MASQIELIQHLSKRTGIQEKELLDILDKGIKDFYLAAVIIDKYSIRKDVLGKYWGEYLGFTYVDPLDSITNMEYIKKAGLEFIIRYNILPLYKLGKAVTVAMSEPENPFLQNKVEDQLGELISPVFCFPFDIEHYILSESLPKKLRRDVD